MDSHLGRRSIGFAGRTLAHGDCRKYSIFNRRWSLREEAKMGDKQYIGYCDVCGQPVLIRCSAPRHCLHLLLCLLTQGIWLVVWMVVAFSSWWCTCCRCRRKVWCLFSWKPLPPANHARPWTADQRAVIDGGMKRTTGPINFNAQLIENGLVFYAPTSDSGPCM